MGMEEGQEVVGAKSSKSHCTALPIDQKCVSVYLYLMHPSKSLFTTIELSLPLSGSCK